MYKKRLPLISFLLVSICIMGYQQRATSDGWLTLFDGKTLEGWQLGENPETFSVTGGMIQVHGERAHLFYEGPVMNAEFKNFEFKADIKTMEGANSGIFIHTGFQQEGWPQKGYEIQVNNSHSDWRRTASVYGVKDVKDVFVNDGEWFTMHIIVLDKKITVKVNDEVVNEYEDLPDGRLEKGTIALQGHDPNSKIFYKNILVKPL